METARVTRSNTLLRWVAFLPLIYAVLVFAFILGTTVKLISFPDDGIDSVNSSGEVQSLAPAGPAFGKLQEGDIIISVEGVPFSSGATNYSALDKKGGSEVEFKVLRQGILTTVTVRLDAPSRDLVMSRMAAILIALMFLLTGIGIDAFKPSGSGNMIYSIWFYTCALTLTAGAASTMRIGFSTALFYICLWMIGAVSVHFHMHFPQLIRWRLKYVFLSILYFISFLGIAPLIIFGTVKFRAFSWYPQFLGASQIVLSISLFFVVALLIFSYRSADTPGVRGKIRLVLLGGILVVMPFISLTILPTALLDQPLIPYSIAFLLLGLLPLTYAYAIFRLHLIEIDQKVNRGATLILVYSILGGFYLVLYALLNRYLPTSFRTIPLINTFLVLVLATIFIPLHRWVQRMVDRIFYGGWYDYRIGVRQITENISQLTDLQSLAQTVSERLKNTLRLEEAVVFFRDQNGDFAVVEASFSGGIKEHERREFPVLPRSSLTYLLKIGAAERTALLQSLSQITLTPEEVQLLKTEQIHLWVPVIGHQQIQGLLALGPKIGGDVFSGEDLDILRVVVQQLSPIIENIHLLTDLKQHASELEKRVEERTAELYDAKERVEAILASVGDGVVVTDLEGQILTVNLAFERLSGFSSVEIRGQNLFDILSSENGVARISAMRDTLLNGDIWSDELVGRRIDNSQYNIQFTIAPIHDRQGQPVGYVGSQTDISRQKELDKMKDAFISDVSHELRTPITNISLYIELLKSAPVDRHSRYLEIVKEQSSLLTKLVEDILDLSRLTASKTRPAVFSPIQLNKLAEQVVTAYLPLAEASGVNLVFQPDPDLPVVQVEQNQIARLITNLVTNAVRYSPKGQVFVSTTQDLGWVSIKVEDTGIGIDPHDIPHIFERFFRGSNVRQSEMHGTGLGLAIVKEIVDFHGGTIEVNSVPGVGSCFQAWLPMTQL